ncbi:MAG TPA: hypothetical protein VFK02_19240 [Kofleriaceae bacterium]|nr:hypothetical protein [Kofleriaceae bacterium]
MSADRVGNVARVALVLAACAAAAGSATSSSGGSRNQSTAARDGRGDQDGPPAPQQMEPDRALGLWRSTFGAVKIEPDSSHGGLEAGSVQGIWMYQRQGQDVIGYFAGNLRGNVLEFRWQEPNNPPLTGEGYLVFDVQGRQYAGRWWSDKRDRVGDWNGWRPPVMQGAQGGDPAERNDAYGQPGPRRQAYPPRPSPYQQPYQPPYQQPPYQQPPYQQPYQQPPPYQPSPYQQPSQQPYQQPSQAPYQQPPQPQPQPTYYD